MVLAGSRNVREEALALSAKGFHKGWAAAAIISNGVKALCAMALCPFRTGLSMGQALHMHFGVLAGR
jgi:hypothetical protein